MPSQNISCRQVNDRLTGGVTYFVPSCRAVWHGRKTQAVSAATGVSVSVGRQRDVAERAVDREMLQTVASRWKMAEAHRAGVLHHHQRDVVPVSPRQT